MSANATPRARRRDPSGEGAGTAWAFLAPGAAGLALFTLLPVLASFALALFEWDLFAPARFVGLENFRRLAGDASFWRSLGNTLFFMLRIPVSVFGSLLLAAALAKAGRAAAPARTAFFLPSILMGVPVFILWQWLYAGETGLFNQALERLGLPAAPWLTSPSWSKPSLMLMGLWAGVGGPNMILYLAALQGVNPELYEAARIDGAGRWQTFWRITVPLVSPTTLFILTMEIIAGFQGGFDMAYVMTKGGPAGSTSTIDYFIYQQAYEFSRFGYAASAAWALFALVAAATFLFWRWGARRVHY